MAATAAIRLVAEPAEPSAAARAKAEAALVQTELARLGVVDTQLADAARKVAAIDAELDALDMSARSAVEAWARSGSGAAPAPLLAERRALMARRLDAEAERQAAAISVAAVADTRAELGADLRRLEGEARVAAVESFGEDYERLAEEYAQRVGDVRRLRGELAAIPSALAELGRSFFARGDETSARACYAAAERIRTRPLAEIDPGDAEYQTMLARWQQEIAARISA